MVLFNFSSNRSTEGSTIIRPLSIAFGEGAASIGYSVDGIYWNACNNEAFSIRANHGCWNGKVWVGVGTGGNWVATSYDGINWIGQDNNLLSEGYYIAWNGTVFLAAGVATSSTPRNTFATSPDGFSWTAVSTDIFYNGYANWVGWTGNVWCATGSGGGNTSATSISIYGDVWTGGNNMVTDLSSIATDMVSTYSSSSGVASNAFDKTTAQLEWRTSSASYDTTGSPTNSAFSTAIGSISNTVSGEFLQISAASPVVLKYYLLLFDISGGDALYETPKSWYLLGANSENPDYWNIIDRTQISLSNPPSYGINGYYAVPDVLNNTIAYQYYRILITSTFNDNSYYKSYYARIMEIDLFYSCPTTTTISSQIKPFITPNGISYPVKMNNNYYLVYTDRTNTLVSPAIHGTSYYNTDISCVSDITCSAYDGMNCIIGSIKNLYYTSNFGKTWNVTTVTSENIGMQIYGAAFNGNYFILGGGDGGSGGNVLLYGKSENGLNNWYPCINSNQIFTKVRGVISNSGYGYTVPNNSLYLDLGYKMNIVTPKSYPIGGDVQMSFNLNTFPVSF